MFLIVGLGNPGQQYEGSRHNAGFDLVTALSQQYDIPLRQKKWEALVGEGRIGREKVILMQPQTYMNDSGRAVAPCARFYKLEPEQILVVLDDVDLEFGRIRLRERGSAGTHNGLKSITQALGSQNFARLKLSVGRDPKVRDLAAWVLGRFDAEERVVFEEELEAGLRACELIFEGEMGQAMTRYNGWQAPSAQAFLEKRERNGEE